MGRNGSVGPGIAGGGFDVLHVVDCSIRAKSYCGYGYDATGDCAIDYPCQGSDGAPGIGVGIATVIVENSFVEASAVASGGGYRAPPSPGISATGLVVTIDSTVHGGNAGTYFFFGPNKPCQPGERRAWDIPGGPGVHCQDLIDVGSKFVGGRGARWIRTDYDCSDGTYFYDCYSSPDGPQAIVMGADRPTPGAR
jgi:hypothetical protein